MLKNAIKVNKTVKNRLILVGTIGLEPMTSCL